MYSLPLYHLFTMDHCIMFDNIVYSLVRINLHHGSEAYCAQRYCNKSFKNFKS